MAITSNLLLQTQVTKADTTPFNDILSALTQIDRLMQTISGRKVTVDVTLAGNAAQQVQNLQQQISKAVGGATGAGGGGGFGGAKVEIPVATSLRDLSQIRSEFKGIVDANKQVAEHAIKYRQELEKVAAGNTRVIAQTRELKDGLEIITNTATRRSTLGEGLNAKVREEVTTTQKIRNLEQERAVAEAKSAQARERRLQAGAVESKREISSLTAEGFVRSIKESSDATLVLRKEVGKTVDEIARVNVATGNVIRSFRDNTDRVKEFNAEQLQAQQRTLAIANNAKLIDNGFKAVNTSIKQTTKGAQSVVEFQRIRATPADIFKGTPAVDIAKLNTVTGELTATTLEGAKAARLIGDNFLSAAGKVAIWTLSTSAIFGAIRLIKEAVSETVSLEQGTVLLSRVGKGFADSTQGQIEAARNLSNELVNLAAFYGASATEAQQAAAIFARSGLSAAQTAEATKAAIIASRVAEIGVTDAARLLSSELAQFKLSADQLLPSLDRLNTLSNNYRVTTNDLLQSVSRAGSVFAEQGRSETELTALTAILAQTTSRSGAEIGTALKTIASNLERTDVANKLIEKTGVAFQNADGPTGDFNRTLAILSLQLDKLNRLERNNITIGAAGVRQRNIFEAALRGSTDALLAEVKAFTEQGSASSELRLESNTLAAALDRLSGTFTKIVNNANLTQTFSDLVNSLTALLDVVNLLATPFLKFAGFIAIFLALKTGLAIVNSLFIGISASANAMDVSLLASAASTEALTVSMEGAAVASEGLIASMGGINVVLAIIAGVTLLVSNFVSAFTAALRENTLEQDKNREAKNNAARNALDAAKAEQSLTQQFTDQVKALKEVEDQLSFIEAARARSTQQGVPTRETVSPFGAEGPLRARRQQLLESSNRIASGIGLATKDIQDAAQAQQALNELQKESGDLTLKSIDNAKRARSIDEEDLTSQKAKRDELQKQKDEFKDFEQIVTRALRESEDSKTGFEKFLDRVSKGIPFVRNVKSPLEEDKEFLDDLNTRFKEAQDRVQNTQKEIAGLTAKITELGQATDQLAIAQQLQKSIQHTKELKVEIEAVIEATGRISDISDAFGIDKAKAKQLELNRLLEIDIELTKEHNFLIGAGQTERAKDVGKELEKIRKIELDLNTEKSRFEIERLAKFITDTLNGAFQTSANISKRVTVAQRRFFELGEELDTLHELGVSARITETAMNNIFKQAIIDSNTLQTRIRNLSDAQDAAAAKSLRRSLIGVGVSPEPALNQFGLNPTNERKRLEQLVRTKILTPLEREDALLKARRAANEIGPNEADTLLITKVQVERQEAAKRLNELADIQLKIAEELIAKQAEITAEMRQQTKEQIKQLGLLGEEDKLRVLAQAAFFAANPEAKISATQQFLAPADINKIGQEFFAPHLAKEFDVQKEPLGRLFAAAGFGNERTRQLRESQAEIIKRREEFAGKGGATDFDILQKAITESEKFRSKALELQDTLLREFSRKLQEQLGQNLSETAKIFGPGGAVFKDGKLALDITFTPKADVSTFIEAIDRAIEAGFLKIRNRMLEFTREAIQLDREKAGEGAGRVLGPPNVPPPPPGFNRELPPPPPGFGPGPKPQGDGQFAVPPAGQALGGLRYHFPDSSGRPVDVMATKEGSGAILRVMSPDPQVEANSALSLQDITSEHWGTGLLVKRPELQGQRIISPGIHLHQSLRSTANNPRGIGARLYPIGFHAYSELFNTPTKKLTMWDASTSPTAARAIKSAVDKGWLRSEILNYAKYAGDIDDATFIRFLTPAGRRWAESVFQGEAAAEKMSGFRSSATINLNLPGFGPKKPPIHEFVGGHPEYVPRILNRMLEAETKGVTAEAALRGGTNKGTAVAVIGAELLPTVSDTLSGAAGKVGEMLDTPGGHEMEQFRLGKEIAEMDRVRKGQQGWGELIWDMFAGNETNPIKAQERYDAAIKRNKEISQIIKENDAARRAKTVNPGRLGQALPQILPSQAAGAGGRSGYVDPQNPYGKIIRDLTGQDPAAIERMMKKYQRQYYDPAVPHDPGIAGPLRKLSPAEQEAIQLRHIERQLGVFEPRLNFGAGGDQLLPRNNRGLLPRNIPGGAGGKGPGGRFVPRFDFDLEAALETGRDRGIGPGIGPGRALRGPASAGFALRGPGQAGVALRAPGGIFTQSAAQLRAAQQQAALQVELQDRLARIAAGQPANAARPVNPELQGRLARIAAGQPANAARPLTADQQQLQTRLINRALGLDATLGKPGTVNLSQEGSIANIPPPSSPLGRLQQAIKDQRELERLRRKAEFEEGSKQRRDAYNNRGEVFLQNELAKRGIAGGDGGGAGSDFLLAPGQIPGVPANLGGIGPVEQGPGLRRVPVDQMPELLPPPREATPGTPAAYGAGQQPLGSVVHPQIDLGNFMADFEVRFSQVLVNAFTRAAPILADKIEAAMSSLPAKTASYRPTG